MTRACIAGLTSGMPRQHARDRRDRHLGEHAPPRACSPGRGAGVARRRRAGGARSAARPSRPCLFTRRRGGGRCSPGRAPSRARAVGQLDPAVHERRPVGDQVPPDRVALGVEALDVGPVRDRARAGARRPAAPRGGPSATPNAAPSRRPGATRSGRPTTTRRSCRRRSRPSTIRSRQPPAENSLWPGADADAAAMAARRASRGGRCASGTAPRTSAGRVLDEPDELDRLRRRPALVGVGHQHEVGAGRLARAPEALARPPPASGRRP